jgi:hypothetical protein
MKKIITSIMSAALAFGICASAGADVKLADNSKILGKWRVTAESTGLDKERKQLNVTWDFQSNGILKTIGEDTLGRTNAMDIDIKYSVADGLIKKQSAPGREKYDDCAVLELSEKDMTLKCKMLYLFLTRNK